VVAAVVMALPAEAVLVVVAVVAVAVEE